MKLLTWNSSNEVIATWHYLLFVLPTYNSRGGGFTFSTRARMQYSERARLLFLRRYKLPLSPSTSWINWYFPFNKMRILPYAGSFDHISWIWVEMNASLESATSILPFIPLYRKIRQKDTRKKELISCYFWSNLNCFMH